MLLCLYGVVSPLYCCSSVVVLCVTLLLNTRNNKISTLIVIVIFLFLALEPSFIKCSNGFGIAETVELWIRCGNTRFVIFVIRYFNDITSAKKCVARFCKGLFVNTLLQKENWGDFESNRIINKQY